LEIAGTRLEKLFDSKLNFQFPTLWKTGKESKKENPPKYIDIFAKQDNRPVIFELKVHGGTRNSRGEYVFNAFGQVINYYVYLRSIFTDKNQVWGNNLNSVKNLDWNNPILYVIVDDLGQDSQAETFREDIKHIKNYLRCFDQIRFVEVDKNFKTNLIFKNVI
jgi:hypothetical protein